MTPSHVSIPRRIGLVGLAASLFVGIAATAIAKEAPRNLLARPHVLTTEDAADLKWLVDNTKPGVSYQLNLGEPHQRRHLMALLKEGGNSEAKSPRLYAVLKAAAADQANARAAAAPTPLAVSEGTPQPLNYVSTLSNTGGRSFQATGLSSVNGGTPQSSPHLIRLQKPLPIPLFAGSSRRSI